VTGTAPCQQWQQQPHLATAMTTASVSPCVHLQVLHERLLQQHVMPEITNNTITLAASEHHTIHWFLDLQHITAAKSGGPPNDVLCNVLAGDLGSAGHPQPCILPELSERSSQVHRHADVSCKQILRNEAWWGPWGSLTGRGRL
jgi:hypothetical protein